MMPTEQSNNSNNTLVSISYYIEKILPSYIKKLTYASHAAYSCCFAVKFRLDQLLNRTLLDLGMFLSS